MRVFDSATGRIRINVSNEHKRHGSHAVLPGRYTIVPKNRGKPVLRPKKAPPGAGAETPTDPRPHRLGPFPTSLSPGNFSRSLKLPKTASVCTSLPYDGPRAPPSTPVWPHAPAAHVLLPLRSHRARQCPPVSVDPLRVKEIVAVPSRNACAGSAGVRYTPTLCLAVWHALAGTRGLRHPSVRPNHLAAHCFETARRIESVLSPPQSDHHEI